MSNRIFPINQTCPHKDMPKKVYTIYEDDSHVHKAIFCEDCAIEYGVDEVAL